MNPSMNEKHEARNNFVEFNLNYFNYRSDMDWSIKIVKVWRVLNGKGNKNMIYIYI